MLLRYPLLKKNWNEFRMKRERYNERKKLKKEVKIEIAERFAYADILISYKHTNFELKEITSLAKDCIMELATELKIKRTKVSQTRNELKVSKLNKKYVHEITKRLFKICEENVFEVGANNDKNGN